MDKTSRSTLEMNDQVHYRYEGYRMITEMLHIDNGFDDLPTDDRLKQRQYVLLEKVDAYFA